MKPSIFQVLISLLSIRASAELIRLNNETALEDVQRYMSTGLSERAAASYTWCTGFQDCTGSVVDGWCGTDVHLPCTQIRDGPKSMQWYPGTSGLTVRTYTTDNCVLCCGGSAGPDRSGCTGVPANVAQSGIGSIRVD